MPQRRRVSSIDSLIVNRRGFAGHYRPCHRRRLGALQSQTDLGVDSFVPALGNKVDFAISQLADGNPVSAVKQFQEHVLQTAEVVHDLVDTRVDALIAQEVGDAR